MIHIKVKMTIIKPLAIASLLRDRRLKTLRQKLLVAGASIFKFLVLKIMKQFPYFTIKIDCWNAIQSEQFSLLFDFRIKHHHIQ